MRHQGHTPPFRTSSGDPLPGSVAEAGYHRIGGIDQWVMIRGESVANPPLIVLHGGPGMSEMRFFRHYTAGLETSFTVVHWDQRGTAKSFDPRIPRSSMTVEQFLLDLDELVDLVRTRVGHDQVVILGHSWGSVLGVLYAARHPEKVAAYVGAAQSGDSAAAEAASYAFAVAEAERRNDAKALEQLRAIGPPPYGADAVWTERTLLQQFDGQFAPKELWEWGRVLFGGPESSLFDIPNFARGFKFSLDAMWDEVSKIDLAALVPELPMPVFFFLGRHDHWIPPETSLDYFNELDAPSKTLVWFAQSGHMAFIDEPEKFQRSMVELVRPVTATKPPTTPRPRDRELQEALSR